MLLVTKNQPRDRYLSMFTLYCLDIICTKNLIHVIFLEKLPSWSRIKLSNSHLWWMDTNIDTSSVGFLSLNSFNVYDKLLPVHLYYLANLLALVVAPHNLKHNSMLLSYVERPIFCKLTNPLHKYYSVKSLFIIYNRLKSIQFAIRNLI